MSPVVIDFFVGSVIGIVFAVAYFGFKQELWDKQKRSVEAEKK